MHLTLSKKVFRLDIRATKKTGENMPLATIETTQLRKLIRNEMRAFAHELFEEELRFKMIEIALRNTPKISKKEQKEIEELYGGPSGEVAESYTYVRK
jgi:hypothetical protein